MKKFLFFLLIKIIENFDVEIVKTERLIIFRIYFLNELIYEKKCWVDKDFAVVEKIKIDKKNV